jgi:hypothetical protein
MEMELMAVEAVMEAVMVADGDEGGVGDRAQGCMVFNTEAYFAKLFIMQQWTEDLRTELLAATKQYMQVVNTNMKCTSQFQLRPVSLSSNVSELVSLLLLLEHASGCWTGKCIHSCCCCCKTTNKKLKLSKQPL